MGSLDHLPTNIALSHFRKAYMQVTTLAMANGTLINTSVGPIVINNWGFLKFNSYIINFFKSIKSCTNKISMTKKFAQTSISLTP
jgi:hypothetical protein